MLRICALHLSHPSRGHSESGHSLPPPTIPAGPETRTRNLQVTSPTLYSSQGRTLPSGKGRRLPWAPESQDPLMLSIYEMHINRGHANGCLLPMCLLPRQPSACLSWTCSTCLSQIQILCIWSWLPHEAMSLSQLAHLYLALFCERLKGYMLLL